MKVVITGANGFLGWHTRLRLAATTTHEIVVVNRKNWSDLASLVADADAILHIAGVNRADSARAVEEGNVRIGVELADAILAAGRPLRVAMAGTIHSGKDTAYGRGKQAARIHVEKATLKHSGHFVDVCLPNLFGEHCRPNYNSFVATFVDAAIAGTEPTVNDNDIELLHAQEAAETLISALSTDRRQLRPVGLNTRVSEVWNLIREFHNTYIPAGELPDLSTQHRVNLFNTYRSALFPDHYPIRLVPHTDARGSFVETVRCRGGEGQSSFSSTYPQVTRGEHYHLRKIERFAVIQGTAKISLRRMFHDEVIEFDVSGERPVAIDMPVGWAHNITNTGHDILLTQFWSHELHRPDSPDTYPEAVRKECDR